MYIGDTIGLCIIVPLYTGADEHYFVSGNLQFEVFFHSKWLGFVNVSKSHVGGLTFWRHWESLFLWLLVFVQVADFLSECAIRAVLLHELLLIFFIDIDIDTDIDLLTYRIFKFKDLHSNKQQEYKYWKK